MSINKKMNHFQFDEYRMKLIKEKNIAKLIKTYNYLAGKKDPNTKNFWNKKIEKGKIFTELDPMSKDRIFQAVKMVQGENGKILDLGFGYGYFEEGIKQERENFQLYGIDISNFAVEQAKRKYGKNFFTGSIFKIPFKNKFFDFVVSLECLEHIPSNKIFGTLNEIKRVLKTTGKAIFSIPINEKYTPFYNPNNHLRRYSKELFIQELIIAGFKVEKIIQLYAFSSFYSFKKIIQKILPHKWKPNVLLVRCSIYKERAYKDSPRRVIKKELK